jgi:hypothetical protein
MHPELGRQLAKQRAAELRRSGAAAAARPHRARVGAADDAVVIRAARPDDTHALAALAVLDGTSAPLGPALVAEVGGSIRAALPLNGERAFADPFRRTADLVALLEARAAQLGRSPSRRGGRILAWHAPAALRRLV